MQEIASRSLHYGKNKTVKHILLNLVLASDDFCSLLTTFANSLDRPSLVKLAQEKVWLGELTVLTCIGPVEQKKEKISLKV